MVCQNTMAERKVGEKKDCLTYLSLSLFIIKWNQGSNSSKVGTSRLEFPRSFCLYLTQPGDDGCSWPCLAFSMGAGIWNQVLTLVQEKLSPTVPSLQFQDYLQIIFTSLVYVCHRSWHFVYVQLVPQCGMSTFRRNKMAGFWTTPRIWLSHTKRHEMTLGNPHSKEVNLLRWVGYVWGTWDISSRDLNDLLIWGRVGRCLQGRES